MVQNIVNLYDKNDQRNISGKSLNFSVTPPTHIVSSGAEISHPIKVSSGQKYTTLFNTAYFGVTHSRTALYDINGNYIDRVTPVITDGIGTITIPTFYPQADHIRFSYRNVDKDLLMVINGDTYPTGYIPFAGEPEKEWIKNPLYMERVEAVGDSIMWGAGDNGKGWSHRIAVNNQMTCKNRSVSGAVFASEVTDINGNPVPCILDQISSLSDTSKFYLIEGGTNDEDFNVPMGAVMEGKTGPFDETTFCGALESAFSQLLTNCHGKKVLFVIPQKMGNPYWQARRYTRFVKAMEICKKWGIAYVNLWDECYLDPTIAVMRYTYYSDDQHMSPSGYDLTSSILESRMRML